ncbi:unnamed protein product [Candidula unifasciata]|uniref:BZIP domain-containing protein n=1 Tax=Candidula unifasciata TaxID=100452 RepID=A0A8S4A3Q4_9EUPU|nr:unnamed protein product [Candidula unifasciata]
MQTQPNILGSLTLKALLEDPNLKNPPSVGLSSEYLKVKTEDVSELPQFNYGSAFLGPNLWDRSLGNSDFNLEYMDLDEFLSENGIPISTDDTLKDLQAAKCDEPSLSKNESPSHFPCSPHPYLKSKPPSPSTNSLTSISCTSPSSPVIVDFQVTEQDLSLTSVSGEKSFDPRLRNFSEEELKPQPVIKKSKKMFVPEELKDDKYWARRNKNNFAARRSRDARRVKENQIALRAAFLEKENTCLREEVTKLQKENAQLRANVAKYEGTL